MNLLNFDNNIIIINELCFERIILNKIELRCGTLFRLLLHYINILQLVRIIK